MNCIGAYREALIRDLSSTASPAPASTQAPSQRQAAEAGREGVVGRPLRRRRNPGPDDPEGRGAAAADEVAESGPAMALAEDATVVDGEVNDQR
jgi:hypothetical protein